MSTGPSVRLACINKGIVHVYIYNFSRCKCIKTKHVILQHIYNYNKTYEANTVLTNTGKHDQESTYNCSNMQCGATRRIVSNSTQDLHQVQQVVRKDENYIARYKQKKFQQIYTRYTNNHSQD